MNVEADILSPDSTQKLGRKVKRGGPIDLAAWDVAIIEEDGQSDLPN